MPRLPDEPGADGGEKIHFFIASYIIEKCTYAHFYKNINVLNPVEHILTYFDEFCKKVGLSVIVNITPSVILGDELK